MSIRYSVSTILGHTRYIKSTHAQSGMNTVSAFSECHTPDPVVPSGSSVLVPGVICLSPAPRLYYNLAIPLILRQSVPIPCHRGLLSCLIKTSLPSSIHIPDFLLIGKNKRSRKTDIELLCGEGIANGFPIKSNTGQDIYYCCQTKCTVVYLKTTHLARK